MSPNSNRAGEIQSFPQRLHHATPSWATASSYFHIRLRAASGSSLVEPLGAGVLLQAALHYHYAGRWHCRIFLLMPDHLHALLAFPAGFSMSRVVGEWKRYTTQVGKIRWQKNYFDHRIRNPRELQEKFAYVLRNPGVKGLCPRTEDWPWCWAGTAQAANV